MARRLLTLLAACARPSSAARAPLSTPLAGPSGEPSTASTTYTIVNRNSGKFRFVATASGGWVRIVNQATGKVADVANCSTADGADVRQWSWLSNTCQQWQLKPA
ncbi:RICIN domain-containing protein [Streptomyces jeddahensis]|uniref:Ricin B lectin domain-containing protein n=1 Tax=Streptomyces jeddahensis TaxID=1716141 RepID=A0A177HYR8_9ACTN|nr:RICIN domain-containing protein [Streptomyces jeddahensis]OAH15926.1 hypothetical protein STSP_07090 [Streptomyces jeddahensis]